jgi:hypothetical protein
MKKRIYKIAIALQDNKFYPREYELLVLGNDFPAALKKANMFIKKLREPEGYLVNQIEYLGEVTE